MTGMTAEAEIFEQHRRLLTGVAYRITGSWTDAEADAPHDARTY
jgi:DNA-directed RNA polymerase specialized sigma24 family protein